MREVVEMHMQRNTTNIYKHVDNMSILVKERNPTVKNTQDLQINHPPKQDFHTSISRSCQATERNSSHPVLRESPALVHLQTHEAHN